MDIQPVIGKYSREYSVSLKKSSRHFKALVEFLQLSSKSTLPCFPDKTIDNAWHTFILYTKLYREHCYEQLGKFIDHTPIDESLEPRLGYMCKYNSETGSLEYELKKIGNATCDGGSCSSCSSCSD